MSYEDFIGRKLAFIGGAGIEAADLPTGLFDFQDALTRWALKRGRAAIFADTGLGVDEPQHRALGQAARQQHFLEREVRVVFQVPFELLAQAPDLRPVFVRLVLWQVDLVPREISYFLVVDVLPSHWNLFFVAIGDIAMQDMSSMMTRFVKLVKLHMSISP